MKTPKDKYIRFRASSKDQVLIKATARRLGLTQSAFLRASVDSALSRDIGAAEQSGPWLLALCWGQLEAIRGGLLKTSSLTPYQLRETLGQLQEVAQAIHEAALKLKK